MFGRNMRISEMLDFDEVTGCKLWGAPLGLPFSPPISYYIDGLLIDTGPGNANESFKQLINDYSVNQVALTHHHEDHSGNAAYIARSHRVPVYGHALTVEYMKTGFKIKPYEHLMFGKAKALNVKPLSSFVETNKYNFAIYHTPGHSDDHVVYFEKNEGWLFSGDMFLSQKIKYFRSDEDIALIISSLKLMLDLDFKKLFCGHNPQIRNAKKRLREKLVFLEDFKSEVFCLLDKGVSKREVIKQLTKKKEAEIIRLVTLGDVSLKNMVLSSFDAYATEST